jgi:hypothetical protein
VGWLYTAPSIFEPFGMYCPPPHYISDPSDEKAHSALLMACLSYSKRAPAVSYFNLHSVSDSSASLATEEVPLVEKQSFRP